MKKENILDCAKSVIDNEANAVLLLKQHINNDFFDSVKIISASSGRVIVTGIGKSANIANKMVATLNSTGTPAIFMHAADAIHGDLGMVQKDDIVVCFSKSGNTPEIKVLIPLIKTWGNTLIAITGNKKGFLSQNADKTLLAIVESEACPNNLAPTSSTTAQLVIADALAVCLLKYNGFTSADFARNHPGGALGKKLYLRVKDVFQYNKIPSVKTTDTIDTVILEITGKLLGATAVIEDDNKFVGLITDGDLRRMLQKHGSKIVKLNAKDIMTVNPKSIEANTMAAEALHIMESHNITQLIVTEKGEYKGIIHLHNLLKEGFI